MTFDVTSLPLPLEASAIADMKPVAPGQWTDLGRGSETDFELRRADRTEVEFTQENAATVVETTGHYRVHLQVPARLRPGSASVRTRTWIDGVASEWSEPAQYRVQKEPVSPSLMLIEAGRTHELVWPTGDASADVIMTRAGVPLFLRGHFPVAGPTDLRIHLTRGSRAVDLPVADFEDGAQIELPKDFATGDWRLAIGTSDGLVPLREVVTVRVQ